MANYTPTFTKPYPSGWVDKPSKTTPATAAIMNSYDTAIAALEAYLRDNAIKNVSADTTVKSGTKIATITIDGTEYAIYAPNVYYESAITGGTKVGTITVGTNTFDVYAPASSAGGSTVSVVPKTLTGTNIAEITVDGTTYQLYAPTSGGGSGSTVTAEATLTEGTQIGKITIDGVETILYAPTASPITVDAELSATSENAIQNKAVDAAVKKLQQQIDAGGTGGSITVDSALSTTSENPVQNKVVTTELNKKIETLDDESQAPDAVNFDLDSELSLTSVKGVQNKAIAEEFQKYANGTKVVAKATEANTATTASNAEKVNGHTVGTDVPSNAVFTDTVYDDSAVKTSIQNIVNGTTQVGNATKATQDAKGNVIDTTYAKKTEIPQGTVVDDALSSTSANPVQNKVVKAELDQVNSNLDGLGYGENGAKNLFEDEIKWMENITVTRGTKSVSDGKITLTATSADCYTDHYGSSWKNNGIKTIPCKTNTTYTFSWEYEGNSEGRVYIFENGSTNNIRDTINKAHKLSITTSADAEFLTIRVGVFNSGTSITYWNFQLEEGDTATPYEPYIPSVKMLAEENAQQNTEAMDIKMLGWSVPKDCTTKNYVDKYGNFHQIVDRVFLDGDETYAPYNVTVNGAIAINYTQLGISANEKNHILFINNLNKMSAESELADGKVGWFIITTNDNYLYINRKGSASSVDEFKNSLKTNPLEIIYVLDAEIVHKVGNEAITKVKNDLSDLKDGTTPAAKAVADEDGNNIKSTYATKSEIPSTPSSLYETVNVDIITDLFSKSDTQYYVNCERVGNICTLSFWLQATASVDYKNRHELFYIDKIPKNNLTIGFCVVNFNHSVSHTANSAYNYINSISVEEDYNAALKRNFSKVYLLPYRTGGNILSSGYEIIGQISWAVEV